MITGACPFIAGSTVIINGLTLSNGFKVASLASVVAPAARE